MPADTARPTVPMQAMPASPTHVEQLVLALTSVAGETAACAAHGDADTVAVLTDYYAIVADAAARAGGRVVKVIGGGILLAFPRDRARDAVDALHAAQAQATALWRAFDGRCRVQVKVTAGPVMRVPLGPPGDERDDVYGHTLNQLFKTPPDDFVLTPDAQALLG